MGTGRPVASRLPERLASAALQVILGLVGLSPEAIEHEPRREAEDAAYSDSFDVDAVSAHNGKTDRVTPSPRKVLHNNGGAAYLPRIGYPSRIQRRRREMTHALTRGQ